jgi:FAD/FMN-containing dehydrogenase
VWTLDPIASGEEPGWEDFLGAFNDRCSAWGGIPLFNQTPGLEHAHVAHAFGPRLTDFKEARRRFDPDNRMLNDYFARLLR